MGKESKPFKILLADDDEDDCEIFKDALREADASIKLKTVEDGDKLMQYLATVDGEHPDIIFLDINMPCKNGKQCLHEIRSNPVLADVPVIMFSTSSYNADIEEAYANGANLYVAKPTSFTDEVKILKTILSLNRENELLKSERKKFILSANSK